MGGEGILTTTVFTDGGLYNATTNAWTAVPSWPSGAAHQWGVGAWAATEFVVWGGRSLPGGPLTTAGDRYRP